MFEFPDIDKATDLELRKWKEEARGYWTFLKHLLGLWTGFGDRAERLIGIYKWSKGQALMVKELEKAIDWHDVKTVNITGEMDRVNEYMQTINIALGIEPLLDVPNGTEPPPSDFHPSEIP